MGSTQQDCTPQRWALKYSPPALLLHYRLHGEDRLREVQLIGVPADQDASKLAQRVMKQLPHQLAPHAAKLEQQVHRLVSWLLAEMQCPGATSRPYAAASRRSLSPVATTTEPPPLQQLPSPKAESETPTPRSVAHGAIGSASFNSVSSDRTDLHETGSAGSSRSGSHDGSSDVGIAGDAARIAQQHSSDGTAAGSPASSSGELDGVLEAVDSELFPGSGRSSRPAAPAPAPSATVVAAPAADDDDDDDGGVLQLEPDICGDLNRVTEMELALAKAAMEKAFVAHQLRPGDAGYVWDKEVEFTALTAANDWDESGDEGEEEQAEQEQPARQASAAPPAEAAAAGDGRGSKGGDDDEAVSVMSVPDDIDDKVGLVDFSDDDDFGGDGSDLELPGC